jgi:hypothetical protein
MARLLFAVLTFLATSASAQVQVQINIPLPTISFTAPPPLVVVQPGVQVVEDADDEVFFVDGWYWCRREDHWFRTRSHTGGWAVVEPRLVPRTIVAVPPGQYRRWKHGRPATVIVDPPGPGKVKVKVKHGKHH